MLQERRQIVSIRANEKDRKISGTAIVFNRESQLLGGWFTEIIKPGAVTQDLINKSDILMLFNHESNAIPMARSKYGKGTLSIRITSTGVDFEFEARKTPQGDEILAAVRAGDVDGCSFAFIVDEGGDDWQSKPDGNYLRTITSFESLHDFSLVNEPAYLDTSVRTLEQQEKVASLRSRSNLGSYYERMEEELLRIQDPSLAAYYRNLDEEILNLESPELNDYYRSLESELP